VKEAVRKETTRFFRNYLKEKRACEGVLTLFFGRTRSFGLGRGRSSKRLQKKKNGSEKIFGHKCFWDRERGKRRGRVVPSLKSEYFTQKREDFVSERTVQLRRDHSRAPARNTVKISFLIQTKKGKKENT